MYKRVFLISALFVASAACAYYILKPHPEKDAKKALFYLKNNNYPAAELAFKTLPIQTQTLYRGYLEQARGRLHLSDRQLQTAFQDAKKNGRQGVMFEILLARSANAYFDNRDDDVAAFLEKAQALSPNNSGLIFFEGLHSYLQNDFAEALRLWNVYSLEGVGDWLNVSLERLFTPIWKKLHVAHCLIENGDILSGREILEKECHTLKETNQQMHHLTTLFLGLSYLKESHKSPLDQRGSFYKLGRFYFEHSQLPDCFFREKRRVTEYVEEEAEKLLLADLDEEKRKWGFDFIRTLHDWKAQGSIERLSNRLAEKLVKQKGTECVQLCGSIRSEFLGTPFHTQLTEKLLLALAQTLKEGNAQELFELWTLVESISPSPKMAAKEIATLTSDEIFETVKKDNLLLTRTRNFIAFWEKLGRNMNEREILARNLLLHAKLFWHNEKQEKKGQRLMEIALKISNNSPFIEKEIASFLTNLYTQAENSNMIRRLTLIYEAMEIFEINRQEFASNATVANHLADAEYLYEVHNYPAAKTHASWVLKLDPQNEGARKLAGLCSFNLGEYSKAFAYLKELKSPDEDASKALMLSQVFASQEQGKRICQIDTSEAFDETE